MRPLPTFSFLNKVVNVCKRNNIFNVDRDQNTIYGLKYGPLGCLLRRNVFREWLQSLLNNSDVHIFPITASESHALKADNDSCNDREELLINEILHQYSSTQSLVGEHLPFGLAVCHECKPSLSSNDNCSSVKAASTEKQEVVCINESTRPLWKLKAWTCQTIAFFCQPTKAVSWFYYWQRQRYVWWRKFSATPSQISMSDIAETVNSSHQLSLQFRFPWGKENLETVSLVTQNQFVNKNHDVHLKNGEMLEIPNVILCQSDLDFAVLTCVYDAYEEKWQNGKLKTVLRLHHKLAPYKVSVAIDCDDSECQKKLIDVAVRLVRELKQSGVIVLPNPYLTSGQHVELQFDRFDEMGVPYIVVLFETSLTTGIAGLRNRDTTLLEKVHITELMPKLLMYLQMNLGATEIS